MDKIIRYQIKVSEGILAYTHGMTYELTEYHIPELHVCFNFSNDDINVIWDKEHVESRLNQGSNKKEFDLPLDIKNTIQKILTGLIEVETLKPLLKEAVAKNF